MVLLRKILIRTTNVRISSTIQLNFLKRLAKSLSNGYSLLDALETLKWDKQLTKLVDEVIILLKNGNSLDIALEKMSFHQIITSYLYFAKDYGDLESSITNCVANYEKRLHYSQKFTQTIRYPIILSIIFSIVFFFIQHSVLPSLVLLFHQNDQNSQFISIVMTFSSIMYYSFFGFLILVIVIRLTWNFIKDKFSIQLHIFIFKHIPFYRSYVKLNTSYLFSTHMGSLLKTGLSIRDVLALLSEQEKFPIISYYSTILIDGLTEGRPLTELMSRFTFMNPQLTAIFQKNNNIDSLEKDLSLYTTFLMEEINHKIIKLITYIQPIFFILLGLIIVSIYLSLMLPMYQIIQTL